MVEVFSWLYVEGFFPPICCSKIAWNMGLKEPRNSGAWASLPRFLEKIFGEPIIEYAMLRYVNIYLVSHISCCDCRKPQEMPKKYRDASTDEVGGAGIWCHKPWKSRNCNVRVRPVIHEAEIERHPSISGFISMSIFETCLSFKKRRFSAFSVICHICHIIWWNISKLELAESYHLNVVFSVDPVDVPSQSYINLLRFAAWKAGHQAQFWEFGRFFCQG